MALLNPMLLTHTPPAKSEFGFKAPHEFAPARLQHKRFSPEAGRDLLPSFATSLKERMSTPHRGLPPPSSMGLPEPARIAPPPIATSFTGMPAPPAQWQGSEESMRHWLLTKAEEEKRKQEEERTRQENLRLEQRRIEQSMLQESIRNGVPPPLVPLIFAGIGGHNLAGVSVDLLQQYASQIHATQSQFASQQQSQASPDTRRDTRLLAQPYSSAYGAPPGQQIVPAGQTGQGGPPPPPYLSYGPSVTSPSSASRQASGGGPSASSVPPPPLGNLLPRLTTNEMQVQPIPPPPGGPPAPSHSAQPESSSPSIYFHHWVPPTSQAGSGNPPATPSEYASSPKKRKAQGPHQPAPIPTSAPQTSPPFSHVSSSASTPARRAAHYRARSDASMRASDLHGRPMTSSSKDGSAGMPESSQERQRYQEERQERLKQEQGGASGDDRSDSSSRHSSNRPPSAHHYAQARAQRASAPVSPKREGIGAMSTRRGSFAATRPP